MPTFLRTNASPGPRSYSFPPCDSSVPISRLPSSGPRNQTRTTPHNQEDLSDIDDDPFAHFLTPVSEEDDPYDVLSLSAGIIVSDASSGASSSPKTSKFKSSVAEKWARYVRLNHVQLHQRYHDDEDEPASNEEEEEEESFVQLDDYRLLDTLHTAPQLRSPPRPPHIIVSPPNEPEDENFDIGLGSGPGLEMEPTRGRAQELLASGKKAAKARARTRGRRRYSRPQYASGRRRSWREPSPELFTVEESASEEEDTGLELKRRDRAKDGVLEGQGRRRPSCEGLESANEG